MTPVFANKNISSTYEIANWLSLKSSKLYTTSEIKHHIVSRIALASVWLLSLAEAVSRVAVGSMALSISSSKQRFKNFGISQVQKGAHASSISLDCFRSIISSKDLVDCLEAAKPKKILSPEKRLNRVRQGEALR